MIISKEDYNNMTREDVINAMELFNNTTYKKFVFNDEKTKVFIYEENGQIIERDFWNDDPRDWTHFSTKFREALMTEKEFKDETIAGRTFCHYSEKIGFYC